MAKKRSSYMLEYVERTRREIQPVILVRKLVAHVLGDEPMTPSQVTAALGLIKKILPDMTSVDLHAEMDAGPETLQRIERVIIEAATTRVIAEQQAADDLATAQLMAPTAPDNGWLN